MYCLATGTGEGLKSSNHQAARSPTNTTAAMGITIGNLRPLDADIGPLGRSADGRLGCCTGD